MNCDTIFGKNLWLQRIRKKTTTKIYVIITKLWLK
jgi:hypothetical protein